MGMVQATDRPRPTASAGAGGRAATSLLHQIFEQRAAESPEAAAVACRGMETTYGDLDHAANRLARVLRARGVGRGDRVGLLLPRSAEVYVALLATLKAGAAYVPLDPDYPADRIGYILENCQARALITVSDLAPRASASATEIVTLDALADELNAVGDAPLPAIEVGVEPDDACYIIYTSGSTGRPKGVEIAHRSACHLVEAEGILFGVLPEDRVYQGFSIAFDASVEEIWLAFHAGATLIVGTREMAQAGPELAPMLTSARVTVFSTVPTLLALFEHDLPTLRLLILGGEPCPPDLVARWHRPGLRLVNTYGPTEATVIATYADCDPARPVTIGRPVPGYRVYLLDSQLRPVAEGEPGEIHIGGPGLARGYVGLPELTREKFIDNPFLGPDDPWPRLYRSGDLGRWNGAGEIEFVGRIDTQVKLRGFRVELSEIEAVLLECPGVRACVVTLREDEPGLPRLVGYVVPKTRTPLDSRAIRERLHARLPSYMVPARFEPIEQLPTLASGKVDRAALPAPQALDDEPPPVGDDAALSQLERTLLRAWSRLFAPTAVSIHDDFFHDLGGHSLLAARVVSELRNDPAERLQSLSVLDLYKHPTIGDLAASLEREREHNHPADSTEPPSPTAPRTFHEPSSRQHVLCALAQLAAFYLVFGLFSLQWLAPYLTYTWMIERGARVFDALASALGMLVAVYPAMLVISIALKWLVIGRFRAGEYPLWGWTYFRWWLVGMVQEITPVDYLAGTPLLSWYYRLLGARIGSNVYLGSSCLGVFDLITIGDDAVIGFETDLAGACVEDGLLKIGPITIGRGAEVGNRSVVREHAEIADGARLDDLSLLPVGVRIPADERWAGSPARRVGARAGAAGPRPALLQRLAMGLLFAIGSLVVPVLVIGAIFPGLIVIYSLERTTPGAWYLLASPLVALVFVVVLCLEIAAVKWLVLGRVRSGRYSLHGLFYARKWFVDQLLDLSLDVVGPLYATIYLNPWYRLLGARLGRRAEISTASFLSPDLLTIDDEGFIADAVSLGAAHVGDGAFQIDPVRIGRRAFVGNSALLPPGATLADNTLIGCLSTVPTNTSGVASEGTSWLGSPAVFLPQRQESHRFDAEQTFRPTRKLWLQRAVIEFFRIILPLTGFIVLTCLLLSVASTLLRVFSLGILLALFPLLYAGFGAAAALIVVAIKWIMMGRYQPGEHPLWCPFVWKTELVTALYENLARLFLVDMLCGTPFLPVYLRMLGARMGRRVWLGTAEFTEFDLATIGDDAAVNEDATIQTHLFEDRVMKMSRVTIGARCTVGSQSVVLYDTEMRAGSSLGSLSLLMKGESLPAGSRWEGSPARAVKEPTPAS